MNDRARPAENELTVDVWRLRLADCKAANAGWHVMSPAERQRAATLRFKQDRIRFCCTRLFVREVLASYLRNTPATLDFATDARGKPCLAPSGAANEPGLQFNLSHCASVALLAVARGISVGIDVEDSRALPQRDLIASSLFSPIERRALANCAPDRLDEMFLRCWTRKEAVVKALGTGLATPLDTFAVPLEGPGPWQLAWRDDKTNAEIRHQLFDLSDAGVTAALAVEARFGPVRMRVIEHHVATVG